MNKKIKDWLLILASLADDVALVLLVFIFLRLLGIAITWPVIAVLVAVFVASIFIIHKLIIPVLHRRKVNGVEGLIGLKGIVIEPLNPNGLIKIGGEYWKARAIDTTLPRNEKVIVTGYEGLTLIVKPLTPPPASGA